MPSRGQNICGRFFFKRTITSFITDILYRGVNDRGRWLIVSLTWVSVVDVTIAYFLKYLILVDADQYLSPDFSLFLFQGKEKNHV